MPIGSTLTRGLLAGVILLSGAETTLAGGAVPASLFTPEKGFHVRPMTDEERVSAMCVLGATAGMTTTYLVGPSEVIMLVVGGMVVPSSSSILFLSLFGTVAAAGCTIGALATPATSWLSRHLGTQ
ncbi:conserved membrane hypothetical protein [Gammaproteobacteria bacterium]